MSRRTLAALVVGWLLGVITARVIPTLVWQRQTMYDLETIDAAIREGWYVIRRDHGLLTLERSRFRLP